MEMKKLTDKQALTIVEKIIKSNKMDLDVVLEDDALNIVYKEGNLEQAESIVKLFSGDNPKNDQNITPKDSGCLYLVNKNKLFVADVYLVAKEEETDFNFEGIEDILEDVLETKPERIKRGYTAEDIDSWAELLKELQDTGSKYLKYFEVTDLLNLASELKNLYNTSGAPLNKVLVLKFIEQYLFKNTTVDYFMDRVVEPAYKVSFKKHGALSTGWGVVMNDLEKSDEVLSMMLIYSIDSYKGQKTVVSYIDKVAKPLVKEGWDDYLEKLGLSQKEKEYVRHYIKFNSKLLEDPKESLDDLYSTIQKGIQLEIEKEYAFIDTKIKDTHLHPKVIAYLTELYLGKKTNKKIANIVNVYGYLNVEGKNRYYNWLLSVIESFIEDYAEEENVDRGYTQESWEAYIKPLAIDGVTGEEIIEYAQENDLLNSNPKKELSKLYKETQKRMFENKDLIFARTGITGKSIETDLNHYIKIAYNCPETPNSLASVLDAYTMIQSMGSYNDWLTMLCTDYIQGHVEVEVEAERETETVKAPVKEKTHLNFDGEETTLRKDLALYLQYNMQLDKSEANSVLEETYGINEGNIFDVPTAIAEKTREEINLIKKTVVDKLGLQPSASAKGLKITTKMNKFLKENYLEVNETTKGNCLKLFHLVKTHTVTMENFLENMYNVLITDYVDPNQGNMLAVIDTAGLDFVAERVRLTKLLRKAENENTVEQNVIEEYEEKVLDSYREVLTEKLYDKSTLFIKEYSKLFLKK